MAQHRLLFRVISRPARGLRAEELERFIDRVKKTGTRIPNLLVHMVDAGDFAGLEALLREVIDMVAVAHLGQNWESDLSRRIQKDLASNHEHVKRVRSDVAEDPWTVAGLDQIEEVALHFLRAGPETIQNRLRAIWITDEECKADFTRVRRSRATYVHPIEYDVPSEVDDRLVESTVNAIRVKAEYVRRMALRESDEWFPYIERVVCPTVPEWEYSRGSTYPRDAMLSQDDEVELHVTAVHPRSGNLEYVAVEAPPGGSYSAREGWRWQTSNILHVRARFPGRNAMFAVFIRDPEIRGHTTAGTDDEIIFTAEVRPQSE